MAFRPSLEELVPPDQVVKKEERRQKKEDLVWSPNPHKELRFCGAETQNFMRLRRTNCGHGDFQPHLLEI